MDRAQKRGDLTRQKSWQNNTLRSCPHKPCRPFLNYSPTSPVAQAAKHVIEINGDHNLVTECNFVNYTAKRYIHISAHTRHNTIAFCYFENKPTASPSGSLVQLLQHLPFLICVLFIIAEAVCFCANIYFRNII